MLAVCAEIPAHLICSLRNVTCVCRNPCPPYLFTEECYLCVQKSLPTLCVHRRMLAVCAEIPAHLMCSLRNVSCVCRNPCPPYVFTEECYLCVQKSLPTLCVHWGMLPVCAGFHAPPQHGASLQHQLEQAQKSGFAEDKYKQVCMTWHCGTDRCVWHDTVGQTGVYDMTLGQTGVYDMTLG